MLTLIQKMIVCPQKKKNLKDDGINRSFMESV